MTLTLLYCLTGGVALSLILLLLLIFMVWRMRQDQEFLAGVLLDLSNNFTTPTNAKEAK